MIAPVRAAAMAALAVGLSIGLASPAGADLTPGTYTARELAKPWMFTPCGPDCLTREVLGTGNVADFHLQNGMWTNIDGDCSTTIDPNSLVGSYRCHDLPPLEAHLTKSG